MNRRQREPGIVQDAYRRGVNLLEHAGRLSAIQPHVCDETILAYCIIEWAKRKQDNGKSLRDFIETLQLVLD